MVNSKNTPQARLDRLIAEGWSPTAIENLKKQLGLSTTPVGSMVDTSWLTPDQVNFEKGWQGYIDASKSVHDIETSRQVDLYNQRQQQLELQSKRNREDYAKYTSTAQSQMNRQLASSSKDFARKLSAASNAYGQRGILKSWIAKTNIGNATQEFSNDQVYFKTEGQRQIEEQQNAYNRQLEDITTSKNQNTTQENQYIGDRAVSKKILESGLQYEGDTQYNTMQTQQWKDEQARLAIEAKNAALGITKSPTLRTWRRGWTYSAS